MIKTIKTFNFTKQNIYQAYKKNNKAKTYMFLNFLYG